MSKENKPIKWISLLPVVVSMRVLNLLKMKDIGNIDRAHCNKEERPQLLKLLKTRILVKGRTETTLRFMMWLVRRGTGRLIDMLSFDYSSNDTLERALNGSKKDIEECTDGFTRTRLTPTDLEHVRTRVLSKLHKLSIVGEHGTTIHRCVEVASKFCKMLCGLNVAGVNYNGDQALHDEYNQLMKVLLIQNSKTLVNIRVSVDKHFGAFSTFTLETLRECPHLVTINITVEVLSFPAITVVLLTCRKLQKMLICSKKYNMFAYDNTDGTSIRLGGDNKSIQSELVNFCGIISKDLSRLDLGHVALTSPIVEDLMRNRFVHLHTITLYNQSVKHVPVILKECKSLVVFAIYNQRHIYSGKIQPTLSEENINTKHLQHLIVDSCFVNSIDLVTILKTCKELIYFNFVKEYWVDSEEDYYCGDGEWRGSEKNEYKSVLKFVKRKSALWCGGDGLIVVKKDCSMVHNWVNDCDVEVKDFKCGCFEREIKPVVVEDA